MITYEQIQVKLSQAIEQSGLSKAEIAKMIGVKEKTLRNYLSGKTKPQVYVFAKLCGALNLNPNEILCLIK
ncbi:MAG: helix-turn-helix transcriptional regulator [Clostridiales bacterium]|nr:helix-turn-helix transcriptional regulator [Clostridiales bacterium]